MVGKIQQMQRMLQKIREHGTTDITDKVERPTATRSTHPFFLNYSAHSTFVLLYLYISYLNFKGQFIQNCKISGCFY